MNTASAGLADQGAEALDCLTPTQESYIVLVT
jgi:hypothetical protein